MTTPARVRLLLLEDNPRDAELIERCLQREQLDFSVIVVDDEAHFRSALLNDDPDVILSDYNLPGFDGTGALRLARTLAPSTPFIFVSGSIGEERAVEALLEGATDYVRKDHLPRLSSAIIRALTERRERSLRKDAESTLRISEQRFQYAAAATREIIWDWDLATSRIWFSNALCDHWGYEAAQSQGDGGWFRQRIHPDDRDRVMLSFQEALAWKDRWTAEFRFARADQSYSQVLVRGLIVCDTAGNPTRVIGAVIDITERLHLERQLEQTRRIESLGRVAATVAHEFNNVLMGILPLATVLRRSAGGNPTLERIAGQITDSISRGRRLTDQILRFGTPAEPAFTSVSIGEWLDQITPELRSLAGDRVQVTAIPPESTLTLSIDGPQMQQVLSNLVVNARDAMPDGGTITIAAEADAESLALTITDEGTGMAPEVVQRIFEPLYTTKRKGTGLGLAVAYQIVTGHHGSIEVTSTPGRGSTFRILLPLAS